jgi:hypothetical protein
MGNDKEKGNVKIKVKKKIIKRNKMKKGKSVMKKMKEKMNIFCE